MGSYSSGICREFGSGPLFVSPESGLKFYRGDLRRADLTLFRMAAELVRPDDTVWDIGANLSLFSFAAAAIEQRRELSQAVWDTLALPMASGSQLARKAEER